ncbi:uncharacterized protein OCT59_022509 [Rhizophagus irregularis]|uniref:uncharacterized protein n=1 Tax=Rhizophagus irregularis TaxID=588596 RepID=UPI00332B581F|nr:hypothetical protein OCT59_022509 [Rhizophagus irregularis]
MDGTPARLGLNPVETEVYNNMIARERITFNALPDDNARIGYVRALVDRDRTWRERSDISQKLIYCGLYVSALIVLAVLGSTKFKNNEETLKYFSLALNSMIFITEIIMLFNKLRWNNIVCLIILMIGTNKTGRGMWSLSISICKTVFEYRGINGMTKCTLAMKHLPEDILREELDISSIKSNEAIPDYGPCMECDIPILTEDPPKSLVLNTLYRKKTFSRHSDQADALGIISNPPIPDPRKTSQSSGISPLSNLMGTFALSSPPIRMGGIEGTATQQVKSTLSIPFTS